ncbi:unnamed protein product, partial [Lymnaea stagnalis]
SSSEDEKKPTVKKPVAATSKPTVPAAKVAKKPESSDSDSSSSEDEKKSAVKKQVAATSKPTAPAAKVAKKQESSDSDSSSSEDEKKPAAAKPLVGAANAVKKQSSDSDSDSTSDDSKKVIKSVNTSNKNSTRLSKDTSDSDSDSSSSNDGNSNFSVATPSLLSKSSKPVESSTPSENSIKSKQKVSSETSESSNDDVLQNSVNKTPSSKLNLSQKQNINYSDSSFSTNGTPKSNGFLTPGGDASQSQGKRTPNEPFRRVKSEQIYVDPKFRDNSFEAKSGARGSWGEKANKDLIVTRGKGFKHEKTKKKRGSYRGGPIDTAVHSIKFDDSE